MTVRVEAEALRAVARDALLDHEAAAAAIERALDAAERHDLRRCLLGAGPRLLAVLHRHVRGVTAHGALAAELVTVLEGGVFMQGLTEANVRDGGAVFNTAGFDISVAQLLRAAGSGGVSKTGLGTLTIGTNTFTGPSSVQQGKLVVSTAHAGGGSFSVQDGASLGIKVAAAGSTLKASTVTLGVSSGAACAFDLGGGNPTAVPLYATNVVTHGTVTINVTASWAPCRDNSRSAAMTARSVVAGLPLSQSAPCHRGLTPLWLITMPLTRWTCSSTR